MHLNMKIRNQRDEVKLIYFSGGQNILCPIADVILPCVRRLLKTIVRLLWLYYKYIWNWILSLQYVYKLLRYGTLTNRKNAYTNEIQTDETYLDTKSVVRGANMTPAPPTRNASYPLRDDALTAGRSARTNAPGWYN